MIFYWKTVQTCTHTHTHNHIRMPVQGTTKESCVFVVALSDLKSIWRLLLTTRYGIYIHMYKYDTFKYVCRTVGCLRVCPSTTCLPCLLLLLLLLRRVLLSITTTSSSRYTLDGKRNPQDTRPAACPSYRSLSGLPTCVLTTRGRLTSWSIVLLRIVSWLKRKTCVCAPILM